MSSDESSGGAPERGSRWRDNFVAGWARAVVLGIRDTADDMLDEGRKSARAAYDEGWERFDTRTRYRRAKHPRGTKPPARD